MERMRWDDSGGSSLGNGSAWCVVFGLVLVVLLSGTVVAAPGGDSIREGGQYAIENDTTGYLNGEQIAVEESDSGTVVSEPSQYENTTWVKFDNTTMVFWVPADELGRFAPGVALPTVSKLESGETVRIRNTENVWHEDSPTNFTKTRYGTVLAGPRVQDGHTWYEIEIDGEEYWVAQQTMEKYEGEIPETTRSPTPTPTPTATETVSGPEATVTTETSAWHEGSQTNVTAGLTGMVVAGPSQFEGYDWYRLKTDRGAYWIREAALSGDLSELESEPAQTTTEASANPNPGCEKPDRCGEPGGSNGGGAYEPNPNEGNETDTPDQTASPVTTQSESTDGPAVTVISDTTAYQEGETAPVESGTTGTAVNGPVTYDGHSWYKVATDDGTYWIKNAALSGDLAEVTPTATERPATTTSKTTVDPGCETAGQCGQPGHGGAAGTMEPTVGERAFVSDGRSTAWRGDERTTVATGFTGRVLSGPTEYEGDQWFKLATDLGEYWIKDTDLMPTSELESVSEIDVEVGAAGNKTTYSAGTRLMVEAGAPAYQGSSKTQVPKGLTGTVKEGPYDYNADTWYKLATEEGGYWVPWRVLTEVSDQTTTTPAPTTTASEAATFTNGQTVHVTESTTAWTDSTEVEVDRGLTGDVVEGPTDYEGQTWYKLETDDGMYWVPVPALAAGEPSFTTTTTENTSTPAYATGDRVYVEERSTAWTQSTETTVDRGMGGKVISGPTEYEGQVWYQLDSDGQAYWVPAPSLTTTAVTATATPEPLRLSTNPNDTIGLTRDTTAYHDEEAMTLEKGFSASLVKGPVEYQGQNWYLLNNDNEKYWVPRTALPDENPR